MRFEGKLDKWNDDRGFGFITPTHGGEPVCSCASPRSRPTPRVCTRRSLKPRPPLIYLNSRT